MDGAEPMSFHIGAAAAAVASIRTDTARRTGCQEWDARGVAKALEATEGAPGDVLAAAALAASDPGLRVPSQAGFRAHWPKNASEPPRTSHNVPCPDHPEHDMPCPNPSTLTAEQVAQLAAEARAALAAAPAYVPPAIKRAQAQEAQ